MKILTSFAYALSFLTKLPVPNTKYDEEAYKRSIFFYPIIGFFIGIAVIIPLKTLFVLYAPSPKVVLIIPFIYVAINYWITGMLHYDGFCDCIDAFSPVGKSKEERLSILKDSNVGALGSGAGTLLIVGKVLAIFCIFWEVSAVPNIHIELSSLFIILIFVPVLGRLAIVLTAYRGKYPREQGTGKSIIENTKFPVAAFCIITTTYLMLSAEIMHPLIYLSVVILNVIYWKIKANQKLSGITGDVLGACCETTELTILLTTLFIF